MGLIFGIAMIITGSVFAHKAKKYSPRIPIGVYPFWFFGGVSIAVWLLL